MTEGATTGSRRRRGKGFDVADLLSQGRARAGSGDEADDPPDKEQRTAERGSSEDLGPPPPTAAPGALPAQAPEEAQPQAAAASGPQSTAAARPRGTTHAAQPSVVAMYNRVPADLKDRVDDASHQLRAMKATNQEIIAALIDQEVDPSTPSGLAALRRRLERYRRTTLGS
jgi:hypothetical protein